MAAGSNTNSQKLTVSEGLELLLQCDGSIVGPEHFGSQAIHQILEVFVQDDCLEEGGEDKVKKKKKGRKRSIRSQDNKSLLRPSYFA